MKPSTPLADPAFPTRDAVLRHGLNALREQRGISHEKFGRRLNAAIADMIPAKGQAAGIPDLDAFTLANEQYDQAMAAWNRRVNRWAAGDVDFPAWLEEPWVTALEALGDTVTRPQLAARHGYIAASMDPIEHTPLADIAALGRLTQEGGDVIVICSTMMADGQIGPEDKPLAERALNEIHEAMVALAEMGERIKSATR